MAESLGLRINDPRFWDATDLRSEIDRVFDICAGCRLCFKFCGSFPALFEMIDKRTEQKRRDYLAAHPEIAAAAERRRREAAEAAPVEREGETGVTFGDELPELEGRARELTEAEIERVVDLCFQCKLCYPNCPYTPPHELAVDFPRLILRWKAQRVRRQGVSVRQRLLRNTRAIGRVASLLPGLSNLGLRNRPNRVLMEKALGIHRDKLMPSYQRETFPRWWKKHRPAVEPAQPLRDGVDSPTPLRVALFSTCVVDYNDPACGRAAVRVLEHNGVEVVWPEGQVCCGMPYLDQGDVDGVLPLVRRNVELLAPWVERGYRVVVPSPSCSLMIREEYPQLVDAEAAHRVSASTHDLDEYLYRIAREGRLKRDFRRRFRRVAYHVPCHIRVQNIGVRGRDLLRLVADEVELIQECSGHDGTWSMSREHFEDSLHWGRKAFEGVRKASGDPCGVACTDCRLAALHLRQGAGCETVHPVVALAHAYGLEDAAPGLRSLPAEGGG